MDSSSLPPSHQVPTQLLSASFKHVTNSYKFYWLLSILEHVRENRSPTIPINNLLARMIANVWYPTNYFRLSFGKQDRLSQIALSLKQKQTLPQDAKRRVVLDAVLAEIASDSPTARQIASLGRYVPYRFLRPFFSQQLKGVSDWKVNKLVAQFAKQSFESSQEPCFYQIVGDDNDIVEIHPVWFDYLQRHLTIVTGFCLWHLLNHLQNSNPNVPNIAGKLFEPEQRSLRQGRKFWRWTGDQVWRQFDRFRPLVVRPT